VSATYSPSENARPLKARSAPLSRSRWPFPSCTEGISDNARFVLGDLLSDLLLGRDHRTAATDVFCRSAARRDGSRATKSGEWMQGDVRRAVAKSANGCWGDGEGASVDAARYDAKTVGIMGRRDGPAVLALRLRDTASIRKGSVSRRKRRTLGNASHSP
jgi:hypothetical protein